VNFPFQLPPIAFHNPELLWLLLALPILILLRGRVGRTAAIQFSSIAIARQVSGASRSRAGGVLFSLRLLGLAALVVALARPQLPQGHSEVEASGIDIVLALDLSGSMAALDLSENNDYSTRVEMAKKVMTEFIERRPNDRIGMVAFAGNPYLVSPLTLNHDWLIKNIERLHLGIIEDGTAIGSAIGMATNRLRDLPGKSRVIILLTDGENNAGSISPVAAAEAAATYKAKIYAIGAGSDKPVALPRLDEQGRVITNSRGEALAATDPFGNKQYVDGVNGEELKKIADLTGGQYYRATDGAQLHKIYDEIDRQEKTTAKLRHFSTYQELFYWPTVLGLCLVGVEQLLAHTRLRRLP